MSPDIKNSFLFQKNRFLGSDLKSYLGIQYGTFLLRKKKTVLLYICRVVLVPYSEKNTPLALPNLPPLPIPTQKRQHAAAELFGQRRQGGGNGNVRTLAAVHPWKSVAVGVGGVAAGGGGGACFAWLVLGSGR
jgi:hypothetical protein